jgi:ppGpp synthetase/RelA/SpoT-type nucleotidyltranferase
VGISADEVKQLKQQYDQLAPTYGALGQELKTQLENLLNQENIQLATPIESRTKTWDSIVEKCERNQLKPQKIGDIHDVSGIRIVVLFRRDVETVRQMIRKHFEVLHEEDTGDRLADDQFGYGSIHFEIKLRESWLAVPTLQKLQGLVAEIQLRTASQHIWAAASHTLQYKRESHVPKPLRRVINQAAALLETVDDAFERVLQERQEYINQVKSGGATAQLDVETLKRVLGSELPEKNRKDDEPYAELLDDLAHFNVLTTDQLRAILKKHQERVAKAEADALASRLADVKAGKPLLGTTMDRIQNGVFFTHVGLAREALRAEFPDFAKYNLEVARHRGREGRR